MTTFSEVASVVVTLRGGVVASLEVLQRLWALEHRGARFELLEDGRFRVVPIDVLTPEDKSFLRAHRDEARTLLDYEAEVRV
jgi:hypothetical protein